MQINGEYIPSHGGAGSILALMLLDGEASSSNGREDLKMILYHYTASVMCPTDRWQMAF